MHEDLEKVLFNREQIHERIAELAGEISRDYRDRDLMLVAVLKGAVFFLAHLAQKIEVPFETDFLAIAAFPPAGLCPVWSASPRIWTWTS